MKHKLLLLTVLLTVVSGLQAKDVNEKDALRAASRFFNRNEMRKSSGLDAAKPALSHIIKQGEKNSIYIYNNPSEQGFVLIAGDDRAPEILGYADEGCFRYEAAPANARAFLHYLSAQVETIRNGKKAAETPVFSTEVKPLLECQWGQGDPYNRECPTYKNKKTVTGCVATAMAQVMYYHQWPQKATGKINYHTTSYKMNLERDLGLSAYDWDNMQPTYNSNSSQKAIDAVSKLMADCGYAAFMDYTPYASAAATTDMMKAIVNNFGYDKGTRLLSGMFYSAEEWSLMVKEELDAKRPILYGGATEKLEGHQFVCDGYNKDGLFHINWGWEGVSDGYFRLTMLDPEDQGTGGSSGDLAFTLYIDAVFGMQPPTEGTVEMPYILYFEDCNTTIHLKVLSVKLLDLYNYGYGEFKGNIRLDVYNLTTEEVLCSKESADLSLIDGYGYSEIELLLNLPKMPYGTYGIRVVSVDDNEVEETIKGTDSMLINYLLVNENGYSLTDQLPTQIDTLQTAETTFHISKGDQRICFAGNAPILQIEIYSLQGTRLAQTKGQSFVGLNGLTPGCYLIRWQTPQGWHTQKFCF